MSSTLSSNSCPELSPF